MRLLAARPVQIRCDVGSVCFSQHHLGVPGTFPYSFPYPVCCEQFWEHDLGNEWGGSCLPLPYVTVLAPLSNAPQPPPWAVRSWNFLSTLHSPGTASGIASISTLMQNYSIIRRNMWQWRYSSFYIFYHTRAIFSFFSTLIINLFIENWLTKNLWISKSIIMMNGNYHLNPESFISLFTICQVIQECMNTCLVRISQLIVIFAWTLDLYAKY